MTLEKVYDPRSVEPEMYAAWEASGAFIAAPDGRPRERTFSIVIPPPNVTGALHLGHALNNTLQDVLVRWHRMRGFNTLWQPGTDHAGIATQAVVEKRIREQEGLTRHQLAATPQEAREELVRRIWKWKDEYEQRILSQLRLMGCSCDWGYREVTAPRDSSGGATRFERDGHRTRFTFDEGLSRAVRHIFFKLFKDGLIFRGKRLVNWDTQLQTAVADDEVYHDTVKGHFYYIRYPVLPPGPAQQSRDTAQPYRDREGAGSERQQATGNRQQATGGPEPQYVIIATTRPETMLADVAVAVHPDPEGHFARLEQELRELGDRLSSRSSKEAQEIQTRLDALAERRASHLPLLIQLRDLARAGRKLLLPLVEREIPLICDEWADPMLGTGCVKITPAHDPNDYEVGLRHKLPMINVLTPDGKIARIDEPPGTLVHRSDGTRIPFPQGGTNPHSADYEGLEFSTAGRKKVVTELESRGLLEKIEDRDIDLAHSDRSKTPVEPFLSDQWFVRTGEPVGSRDDGSQISDLKSRKGLAQAAMDEVTCGRIQVFPSRYAKSYLDWLGEKRDWCISRQLWWGHRISVWTRIVSFTAGPAPGTPPVEDLSVEYYIPRALNLTFPGPNLTDHSLKLSSMEEYLCVRDQATARDRDILRAHHYREDPDVLDTWFSSALWPFSTLGWPEETADLKQYYPTSVLCTSRDIITNWVARMVMFGLYALGKKPFDHVYIHPKILDGRGETMSKSKGNGVDPVDIIHTHGADALRYTMVDMTTETQDIRMPVEYVCPHCGKLTEQSLAIKAEEQNRKSRGIKLDRALQPSDVQRVKCSHKECGQEFATQWADADAKQQLGLGRETSEKFDMGRNFCNKLWNAARFAFMNLEGAPCGRIEPSELLPEDRWILARLSQTCRRVHDLLSQYQFSATVKELRDFFWDSLCDWYIELSKPRMGAFTPVPAGEGIVDQEHRLETCATPHRLETGATQQESIAPRLETGATRVAQQVLAFCMDQTLRLFHPIIPFITERLWQQLGEIVPRRGLPGLADLPDPRLAENARERLLVTAQYPPEAGYPALEDAAFIEVFARLQDVVRAVRDLRARCNVAPKDTVRAIVVLPPQYHDEFRAHTHVIQRMAGVGEVTVSADAKRPVNAGSLHVGALRVYVLDISDDAAERQRATKELADVTKQIQSREGKLSNEKFVANAAPQLVEAERARLAELQAQRRSLEEHLAELA